MEVELYIRDWDDARRQGLLNQAGIEPAAISPGIGEAIAEGYENFLASRPRIREVEAQRIRWYLHRRYPSQEQG